MAVDCRGLKGLREYKVSAVLKVTMEDQVLLANLDYLVIQVLQGYQGDKGDKGDRGLTATFKGDKFSTGIIEGPPGPPGPP
ncbi:hypothetical protein U1Q18_051033, partial [Sarracenia purpurea var. burkii]